MSAPCNILRRKTGNVMMTDEFAETNVAVLGYAPNVFEINYYQNNAVAVGDHWVFLEFLVISFGKKWFFAK